MKTFSELADLMDPEWFVASWGRMHEAVSIRFERDGDVRLSDTRLMHETRTFAKFSASGTGDTQTIHITLEPKP